jgi:hypothetical protein
LVIDAKSVQNPCKEQRGLAHSPPSPSFGAAGTICGRPRASVKRYAFWSAAALWRFRLNRAEPRQAALAEKEFRRPAPPGFTVGRDPQHRVASWGLRFRLRQPAKYAGCARCSQRCVDPDCRLSMSLVSCGSCKIGAWYSQKAIPKIAANALPAGQNLLNSLRVKGMFGRQLDQRVFAGDVESPLAL